MQWMVKFAGMACILAAGLLGGLGLESRLKKRYAILREMGEMLTFLEKEMVYHRAPVPEAFMSASRRCNTELRGVFAEAAEAVSLREGKDFQEIWEGAVGRNMPGGLLEAEAMELICESAAALCNTDTVLQRTLMEKYADRFRELGRLAFEAYTEKGSLYRKLAMAAGVFLILIFL